jgi:hypothetical protein
LFRAFKFYGYPRRERAEAAAAAQLEHGLRANGQPRTDYRRWRKHQDGLVQPQCAGTVGHGPRTGQPCDRPASKGSDYCVAHDQERAAARTQRLRDMKERRCVSPAEAAAFAEWLRDRVAEAGSAKAAAQQLPIGYETVRRVTRGLSTVNRRTVERCMEAWPQQQLADAA